MVGLFVEKIRKRKTISRKKRSPNKVHGRIPEGKLEISCNPCEDRTQKGRPQGGGASPLARRDKRQHSRGFTDAVLWKGSKTRKFF